MSEIKNEGPLELVAVVRGTATFRRDDGSCYDVSTTTLNSREQQAWDAAEWIKNPTGFCKNQSDQGWDIR